MRRRRLLGAAAAVLLGVVPAVTPSPASATGPGQHAFECGSYLPAFPSPYQVATCVGTGWLTASGVTSNGNAFVITGTGRFEAEFAYAASCFMGQPPPAMTITATTELDGLSGVAGARDVTAVLEMSWDATVVGTDMTINVKEARLTFSTGDTATFIGGAGEGQFVALPGRCPEGGAVQAAAAGEISLL